MQDFKYFEFYLTGYDDNDEKSFYSVYRKIFETILMEDEPHMDDPNEVSQIPSFGNSQSDYDSVRKRMYPLRI